MVRLGRNFSLGKHSNLALWDPMSNDGVSYN